MKSSNKITLSLMCATIFFGIAVYQSRYANNQDVPLESSIYGETLSESELITITEEFKIKSASDSWLPIDDGKGKYGDFIVKMDNGTASQDHVWIAYVYKKCTDKMPYCEKLEKLDWLCPWQRYRISETVTYKNYTLLKNSVDKSEWGDVKEGTIPHKVHDLICPNRFVKQSYEMLTKKVLGGVDYGSSERISKPAELDFNYTPLYQDKKEKIPKLKSSHCDPRRYRAVCIDGSCSRSTGRGTCSHHGGVAFYL